MSMRKMSYANSSGNASLSRLIDSGPGSRSFNIKLSDSPKYAEFTKDFLDTEGNVRSDIYQTLLTRPYVKRVRPGYDFETKRWCLEILTSSPVILSRDPFIASLPCRFVSLEGLSRI